MSMSLQSTTFPNPVLPRVAGDLLGRLSRWMSGTTARRAVSRADDAAAVRELAYRVQNTDPGFASDLFAAAARYEGQER